MPTEEVIICDIKDRSFKPTGPVAGSLGPHLLGVCCPKPHLTNPYMQNAAVAKRVGADLPKPFPILLKRFKSFVGGFTQSEFEPLIEEDLFDFEGWLASRRDYTEKQKDQFRAMYKILVDEYEFTNPDRRMTFIVNFTKDEFYDDWKYCRGIYSRADWSKLIFGPMIHSVEKRVFDRFEFIKKVPVEDRPDFILSLFDLNQKVYSSDYTSFESSFRREIMDACENQMYRRLVQGTSMAPLMEYFIRVTNGVNYFESNHGVFGLLQARRMSGEMTTSLGNGFTNLMMIYFMAHSQGIDWHEVKAIIEGDDSLFQHPRLKPDEDYYSKMGFSIKLETHDSVSTASFCGLIFDPVARANLADPMKMIARFGWGPAKYAASKRSLQSGLVLAKALSFACQYPGCPIIYPFAKRFIQLLTVSKSTQVHVPLEHLDSYQRSVVERAFEKKVWMHDVPIHENSRALMAQKFGIPESIQKALEDSFLDITDPTAPLDLPLLNLYVPTSWTEFWNSNVFSINPKMFNIWDITEKREVDEFYTDMTDIGFENIVTTILGTYHPVPP